MSIRKIIYFNRILFVLNLLVLIGVSSLMIFGVFNYFNEGQILTAKRLVLKGESGNTTMVLQGDDENTLISLNDSNGNARLQIQGGEFPALIMKNQSQEIVGTIFPLKDGGAALGLGDREGNMATFIRGGSDPTANFYSKSSEPNIALGIGSDLSYFVMKSSKSREGIMIHGDEPTSIIFTDENGEIPVSLSRYGLKEKAKENNVKEKEPLLRKELSSWVDVCDQSKPSN